MKALAILIVPSLTLCAFFLACAFYRWFRRRQLLNRRVAESCRYRFEPSLRHPRRLPAGRAGGGNGARGEETSGHRFMLARCA